MIPSPKRLHRGAPFNWNAHASIIDPMVRPSDSSFVPGGWDLSSGQHFMPQDRYISPFHLRAEATVEFAPYTVLYASVTSQGPHNDQLPAIGLTTSVGEIGASFMVTPGSGVLKANEPGIVSIIPPDVPVILKGDPNHLPGEGEFCGPDQVTGLLSNEEIGLYTISPKLAGDFYWVCRPQSSVFVGRLTSQMTAAVIQTGNFLAPGQGQAELLRYDSATTTLQPIGQSFTVYNLGTDASDDPTTKHVAVAIQQNAADGLLYAMQVCDPPDIP